MKRLIYIVLIITLMLGTSACEGTDPKDAGNDSGTAVEESKDITNEGTVDSTVESVQADEVSPEFDENGNPTGEYARYIWEQQQKDDAMNALAEEAMRKEYEEDYSDHVFPLD